MKKIFTLALIVIFGASLAKSVFAMSSLEAVYAARPDLQKAFDLTEQHEAIVGSGAGFLMNLEDWARQYGWQTHPELASYKPTVKAPSNSPSARGNGTDAITGGGLTVQPKVTAAKYIVIDDASGKILAERKAGESWPIASITKLMTIGLALDSGLDVGGVGDVRTSDEVGGARLNVVNGTKFTTRDLLAATLVGSANNAANAVVRLTGLTKVDFVTAMNDRAVELGLAQTQFVDPTGIELGNVSTAREVAYFAKKAFDNENIRHFVGSSRVHLAALNDANYVRDITNTNWMLYNSAYADVYVTAGKTGFLNESGWNAVVQLHPMSDKDNRRSLTVVVFGAASRRDSFDDIAVLARSTWQNFSW
jgi:D-alanyl-D-alanine endopeptidase (penicillin-binding protein 7)